MARASAPQDAQSQAGVSRRGESSVSSTATPPVATLRSTAFTSPENGARPTVRANATAVPTAACGGMSSSNNPAAPMRSTSRTGSGGALRISGSSTASSVPARRSTAAARRCPAERSRASIAGSAFNASSNVRRRSNTASAARKLLPGLDPPCLFPRTIHPPLFTRHYSPLWARGCRDRSGRPRRCAA